MTSRTRRRNVGAPSTLLLASLPWLTRGSALAEVSLPAVHSALPRPQLLRAEDGLLSVSLALSAMRLSGPDVSLVTRGFNGTLPAIGLAVRPGDRLRIRYTNRLEAPLGPNLPNNFHFPNTTNLHLHGLHVSSQAPSDDVLDVALGPGEEWQYDYQIIPDHSPGTYWVHPHHHGSAVLQTGAGAAAPLVVLDPPGYLSAQLEAMEDDVFMLQAFPRATLEKAAKAAQDKLFRVEKWTWGKELMLVNGAPEPILNVQSQQWRRLRFVMAGVSSWLYLDFGACEVALLAKDGIYISDFPRVVKRVSLPPGGRADLVVRCPAGPGGKPVQHLVTGQPPPASGGSKTYVGTVFLIEASGAEAKGLAAEPLQAWSPATRPRYLQDLRDEAPACSCATSLGLGGNSRWMAGHLWEGKTHYLHSSPQDAVVERRLSGLAKHPYHAHTYPFQLMESPGGDDPYFQSGDWHDTYLNVVDSEAVVRFNSVDFSGPQVVHCHVLGHSDKGMIAVEMIKGHGESACGCNLLDMEERRPDAPELAAGAEVVSAPLLVLVTVLFAAMFAMIAGASLHLQRSWSAAAAESYYTALAKGPVQPSAPVVPL